MKPRLSLLILLMPWTALADDPASSPVDTDASTSGWKWNFQLLPTALQRRPKVAMTFFTEMTDAGRKLDAPMPQAPAYYVIHAGKPQTFGDSTYRTPPPSEADLRATVLHTLEAAHYLEASLPEHPPTLALVYYWGVHAGIDGLSGEIDPSLVTRNLYQRASLVGGDKFADAWLRAHEDDALRRDTSAPVFGVSSAEHRLAMTSDTVRKLLSQAHEDVYFVVVTAYDAVALARDERVVLWRTKMTVSTQGVAMRETISPLIAASVPYLGHETAEAKPVSRRIYRDGRVELGPLEVVGFEDPDEPADASKPDSEAEGEGATENAPETPAPAPAP